MWQINHCKADYHLSAFSAHIAYHRDPISVRNWSNELLTLLLQIITLFESVINRQFLASKFETTKELSRMQSADPRSVPLLPWIPKTIAAVALRLLELDASIAYTKEDKAEAFEDVKDYDVSYFLLFHIQFVHEGPC